MGLASILEKRFFNIMWRKRNAHNGTYVRNVFAIRLVRVGRHTYGGLYVLAFNDKSRLYIGNYCSIGNDVKFLLSAEHRLDTVSTFPFRARMGAGDAKEALSKGNIIVGDDVWIGEGAIILSGSHIGQGAVIAAGSVVTKDVPPYAIAAGVPAKVIRMRFGQETVRALMEIDYSRLKEEDIKAHLDDLYAAIRSREDIDRMPWLPRRHAMQR